LLVILMLALALEASAPPVRDVIEDLEESQEVARVSSGRQSLRLVWDFSVPLESDPPHTASVHAVQRAAWHPTRRPVTGHSTRKIPPSAADSPSATDAH
jgi:hypothetical protein